MDATTNTNQRLITVLLVLLINLLVLLVIGIIAGWLMMGGGMMGMKGQTMNEMMAACTDMMRNFQSP